QVQGTFRDIKALFETSRHFSRHRGIFRGIKAAPEAEIASRLRQLLSHQPVQQVDRLERAHHHLEIGDAAVITDRDDVDAIDPDAVDLAFKLDDRAGATPPFADKGEAGSAQDRYRTGEIFERDVAPALLGVHDGTFEHRIGV